MDFIFDKGLIMFFLGGVIALIAFKPEKPKKYKVNSDKLAHSYAFCVCVGMSQARGDNLTTSDLHMLARECKHQFAEVAAADALAILEEVTDETTNTGN